MICCCYVGVEGGNQDEVVRQQSEGGHHVEAILNGDESDKLNAKK
jgi:hypothetical protein